MIDYKIGSKLFLVTIDGTYRSTRERGDCTIIKKGRKFATLLGDNGESHKVDMASGESANTFGYFTKCFKNRDSFVDFMEKERALRAVKRRLSLFSTIESLDYEKAIKIADILGIDIS